MSKVKYGVRNGTESLGLFCEGENGDLLFVMKGNIIDINQDILIRSAETQEDVTIDMRDVILNAIKPKVKEDSVVNNFTITINKESDVEKLVQDFKNISKTWREVKNESTT